MYSILACVCVLAILPINMCTYIEIRPGLTIDAPYYFGYYSTSDTMLATFYLDINLSTAMEVYLVYSVNHGGQGPLVTRQLLPSSIFDSTNTGEYTIKGKAEPRRSNYYYCRLRLIDKQILMRLMFEANASCFDPVTVFEGIAVDRNNTDPGYEYDDRCLGSLPCLIHLNVQNKCPETTEATEAAVTRDKPQTVPECGAETSTLAIVMSTLFSIVFSILVIIVICICCIKISSQGPPGEMNPSQPFYVNMLFRRECDQELAEIDRHYEEIDPGLGERSRNA